MYLLSTAEYRWQVLHVGDTRVTSDGVRALRSASTGRSARDTAPLQLVGVVEERNSTEAMHAGSQPGVRGEGGARRHDFRNLFAV